MTVRRLFQSNRARIVLVVVLVLVVVVTGLPILMGPSMGSCSDCGPVHPVCGVGCPVLPVAVAALPLLGSLGLVVVWSRRRYRLDFAWLIDPPPQLT